MSEVRYRAFCKDDNYKGPWRRDVEDAYEDVRKHRRVPGKEDHLINVIDEQAAA
jgi:hypothetical protein